MTAEVPNTPICNPPSAAQPPMAADRHHLMIPNKLYGRDRDIATLLESFERISGGHGEVLLVPGASGVGKTALVQELQGPIRNRNGFFIKGKFDQYQQNIPYSAFRQALAELCRELQSADAHQRLRFKTEILQAVGNLGQVLVDLVPEFGAFLGAQPPLEDISPQEARHRLADVCRSFLKVICWPEHPLVLFIDDWQWADAASCELLRQMQVGTALRYLLVIASYRDNEVDPGHAFMSAVDYLRSQAVPVAELHVKNITAKDVREFVADTLKPAAEDVAGLAALIHARTRGNPFFVRSFLGFLHEVYLIGFDPARNCWHWSMDKIGGTDLPDDAVGLFVMKLRRLDNDSRNLFSLAACLGTRFDLEALGIISGHTFGECLALLCADQANALILPVDNGGGSFDAENMRAPRACRFVHDRIQQAAYSLIEPDGLPKLLLKIGRLLLASLPPEQLAERLFEVVGDLNAGFHHMTDAAEQEKVLELNLTAARKAYAATAYRSALQFYRAANRFLETPGFAGHLWRGRHEMTLRLFKERAGCEFLEGNLTEAEQCVQQAVVHAGTAIEKADALSILIVQYTLLARYPEAIEAGRQALAALGISLPEADYEKARNEEIAQVRRELGGRPVSSLIELPVMSDPAMLMATKILITMGPPCYRSHQRLWSVIVPKVVNLTLRYGNIPQVGYSHTAFGGLLGWVDDDYATAKEFGELATRLMTGTFRTPADQSVFYLMIGSSIRHWFQHLRQGTQDYHDAYEIGLRSGNLQYAAYAFGHDMYCRFYQGAPLAELIQETQRSLAFSRTRRNQWAIDLLEGGLNIFGALSGESPAPNGNDAWSETDFLRRLADHQNIQVTCIYKVLQTFSLLLAGHHEDALALSDETEPLIYTVGTQGLLPWPEHVFARLLILTALYSKADEKRRTPWRAELDRMLRRLRIWADNGPDNFEHKYLLAAAELARIDGRTGEAVPLYDQAVAAARAGNFLQWEGLANERAHDFWLERGNERLAHVYWQQAYVCFSRWGAAAKVGSMETACRALLVKNLIADDGSAKLEPEIEAALVERQIKQLRDQASQTQRDRLREETATQAEELAHAMQRVRVEIAERKRTEDALRESEKLLVQAQTVAGLGVYTMEITAGFWESSAIMDRVFGIGESYERSVEGWVNLIHPDDRAMMEDYFKNEVIELRQPFDKEYRIIRHDDQSVRWVHGMGVLESDHDNRPIKMFGTIQDITERKQMDVYRDVNLKTLQILNGTDGPYESIRRVLSFVKKQTDTDAVGLRLQDGEDFPYFAQEGFPEDFLLKENVLIGRGQDGSICRDKDGKVCLECICGLVISGKIDTSNPFFTLGGSFWTNNSIQLLDIPPEQDLSLHPRKECIRQGYASVALIPIKGNERILGLLHLNARRKGCFTLDIVKFLEDLALHIGEALTRKKSEDELRRNEARFRSLANLLQYRGEKIQEFLDFALSQAIELTESKLGYIYFYDEDRKLFELNTWSKEVLKECSVVNPKTCYELDKTGIWGEAVRQRRPILLNDFQASHPLKKGMPEGHAKLCRYLTIPVFSDDRIVAVAAVANKASDYGDVDIRQLSLLMSAVWKVTERIRAAEALRESEERFHSLFEDAPLSYQALDAEGRFIEINQAWLDTLGYTHDEIIGHWFGEFLAPEFVDDFRERFPRFKTEGKVHSEFQMIHKSGDRRFIVFEGRIGHRPNGAFLQAHCILEDITERKRNEVELQKLDKLQSIGKLAGGIAHDFNNILQGLFGNISFAMEDLPEDHPACESLKEAEKSMSRAVRLTKQLLTFAKGGSPVKENVELGALVEETVRFDLSGSNVSLVYRQDEDLWPVNADRGQIQQVISNLVINARQAMPKGGHLYLTLENVNLPTEAVPTLGQGRYVKVTVQDEGTGIDPKVLGRIFDPYFSTRPTGSGLGLTTVWSIITKHGGHIGVVSEPGKGATFTFYLPASASLLSEETKTPTADCTPPVRTAKILMMDDEEMVSKLVVRMLEPCGYSVATAPNAQQTNALYKQALEAGTPFDAVIMDLTIPGGSGGKEVIQDLLALDPSVRAIVSSGYADDPVMANPAKYGFKGTAAKPYTAKSLREAVARVLDMAVHSETQPCKP